MLRLEQFVNKKHPELKVTFYVSSRNDFVHMSIDQLLFGFTNYSSVIAEINSFLKENLDNKFLVNYPYLIRTVKWKYDYIVAKERKASRNESRK